jgi:hypothetical protein
MSSSACGVSSGLSGSRHWPSAWSRGLLSLAVLSSVLLATSAQAGKSVGACPDVNTKASLLLVKPGGTLPASAANALKALHGFKPIHTRNTHGEGAWLTELTGTSHPNRVYTTGTVNVVVMRLNETCAASAPCESRLAYVAYAPEAAEWGATVIEGRNLRELVQDAGQTTLAVHKPLILDALSCAQALDE